MERRNTKQYKLIYDFINNNCSHPTAEEVYEEVVKIDPHISLTTVYRNLNKLADEGKIIRISIANQKDRFDFNTYNHYHICCQKCLKFMDVPIHNVDKLNQQVEKITSFKVFEHSIVFTGLCPECQK